MTKKPFYCFALAVLIALSAGTVSLKAQVANQITLKLLSPGGQFSVGHILYDWTDKFRKEPATPDLSDSRQVVAEIWYPSKVNANGKKSPYRFRLESYRSVSDEKTIKHLSSVETEWLEEGTVNESGPFPLFIFSHGWSSKSSSYGTFLSNLASHGYIVVGVNHPYMGQIALANGEVTNPVDSQFVNGEAADEFYARDVIFILNQLKKINNKDPTGRFTGMIDISTVIAGGHSSGFSAASGAAVLDKRIKGLISFDAGVPKVVRREGLDVPLLLFRGETDSYTDLFFRGEKVNPHGTIYDVDFFRMHRADFYDVMILGSTHNSVFDEYLFADNENEAALSKRNHKIFEQFAVSFLEKIFEGKASSILEDDEVIENSKLRVINKFQVSRGNN